MKDISVGEILSMRSLHSITAGVKSASFSVCLTPLYIAGCWMKAYLLMTIATDISSSDLDDVLRLSFGNFTEKPSVTYGNKSNSSKLLFIELIMRALYLVNLRWLKYILWKPPMHCGTWIATINIDQMAVYNTCGTIDGFSRTITKNLKLY